MSQGVNAQWSCGGSGLWWLGARSGWGSSCVGVGPKYLSVTRGGRVRSLQCASVCLWSGPVGARLLGGSGTFCGRERGPDGVGCASELNAPFRSSVCYTRTSSYMARNGYSMAQHGSFMAQPWLIHGSSVAQHGSSWHALLRRGLSRPRAVSRLAAVQADQHGTPNVAGHARRWPT